MKPKQLIIMFSVSLVAMFITMYAMVYVFDHVYLNINKVYMALLMVGAMGVVNVVTMYAMYEKKNVRNWVLGLSIVVIAGSLFFIRNQSAVGNDSFLRSMIPHHSSAILMCERANITDPEIIELCDGIVEVQREEIQIMKDLLKK